MPPVAFLALLTIALLVFAALRLELNFRADKERPHAEPRTPRPEPGTRRPELRAAPAGGYCQAPFFARGVRQ